MEGTGEFQQPKVNELREHGQVMERPSFHWANGFKIRLGTMLKDIGIGRPGVELRFFNKLHRSAEDQAGLKNEFEKCNFYLHETFGWSPEFLKDLRALSEGNFTSAEMSDKWGQKENPHFYARDKELFEIIDGSKKPIGIIDVPESDPLVAREANNKVPAISFGLGFVETTLKSIPKFIGEAGAIEKERETYIAKHLKPQIRELLRAHPELRKERSIAVLMSIGPGHESLIQSLSKKYRSTTISGNTAIGFDYTAKGFLESMSGKPVGEDLALRIAAEWALSRKYVNVVHTGNSSRDAKSMERLISVFTSNELREMFESANNSGEWEKMFMERAKEKLKVPAMAA